MAPIKTNNPYASYFDFFSRTGKDAVTAAPGGAAGLTATGGFINDYTDSGTVYRAHVFTTAGTFTVADLGNICRESDVSANIQAWDIPVPEGVDKLIEKNCITLQDIFSGGDDYELLFTLPADGAKKLTRQFLKAKVFVTQVGEIALKPRKVLLELRDGTTKTLPESEGFNHF